MIQFPLGLSAPSGTFPTFGLFDEPVLLTKSLSFAFGIPITLQFVCIPRGGTPALDSLP